jgi:endonuclease/exonuclease/phosphatase family metal-dependent hydrolase
LSTAIKLSPETAEFVLDKIHSLYTTPPIRGKYSDSHSLEIRAAQERQAEKIRACSFNILFKLNEAKTHPSLSWGARLPLVIEWIRRMDPDILGVQECYLDQLGDILSHIGSIYAHFAGESTSGELNVIFYKRELFEILLDTEIPSSVHELPLDPKDEEIVSSIPGYLPPELEPGRRLTLLNLVFKRTKTPLCVMNTHFSYYRINSRELQASYIKDLASRVSYPLILIGDFNTFPNSPGKELPFYDGDRITSILKRSLLFTRDIALLGHVGPLGTGIKDFFKRAPDPIDPSEALVVLDQIYVSSRVTVIATATLPSERPHPSDHRAVLADLLLPIEPHEA